MYSVRDQRLAEGVGELAYYFVILCTQSTHPVKALHTVVRSVGSNIGIICMYRPPISKFNTFIYWWILHSIGINHVIINLKFTYTRTWWGQHSLWSWLQHFELFQTSLGIMESNSLCTFATHLHSHTLDLIISHRDSGIIWNITLSQSKSCWQLWITQAITTAMRTKCQLERVWRKHKNTYNTPKLRQFTNQYNKFLFDTKK